MKFKLGCLLLLLTVSLTVGPTNVTAGAEEDDDAPRAVLLPTEESSQDNGIDAEHLADESNSKDGLTIYETLLAGQYARKTIVHLPKGYKLKQKLPLVIVLHGARLRGWIARAVTGFDKLADQKKFIVTYPDALNQQWDDGRGPGDNPSHGVNDVQFLTTLIDYLTWKYNADPDHVYIAGYSSGGMLAQKMAMEQTDKIAAIAEVAASIPLPQLNADKKPSRPISVLMINGTSDRAFPWEGGTTTIIRVKVGAVAPVMTMFEYWVQANGGMGDIPNQHISFLKKKDGTDVDVLNTRTTNGRCVMLYKINGGGHTWPGSEVSLRYIPFLGRQTRDLRASELIWEFFRRNEEDCEVL